MLGENRAALFESGSLAVGEKAVAADADEMAGQDVEEEAAHEFVGVELQGPGLVGMGVVLPGEGDGLPIDGEEAVIGDRDAVRVARQVLERLLGPAEGRFGVDGPVVASGPGQETAERVRIVEGCELAVEVQPSLVVGGPGEGEPFAAEDPTEHADGQEEAATTVDPAGAVERESTGGHETVQVRMVQQRLSPGVEEGEEADAGAEMARIRGHLEERLCGRAKQQAIQDAGILKRERRERVRQREDHVRVGDGQERGSLLVEPVCRGRGLAFRAVAVAAGVVRDDPVPARVALVDVPAQCGGPAGKEMLDDALLIAAPGPDPCPGFRQPEDLRDLVSRSRSHRSAVASTGRSSGLRMRCSRNVDTCV